MAYDEKLAGRMLMIASHGQSRKYYHDIVGCNSRLDAMQAAILDIKLKHLDEYIDARRKVADYYDKAFSGYSEITIPFRAADNNHVFHQYTLILEGADRNDLNEQLASKNIPSMIYYPVPGHRQKMFASFNANQYHLPVTDWLTERVISLPMHTELDEEQLSYIAQSVLEYVNQ